MHHDHLPLLRNALRIFCLFLFFSAVSCQEIDNEIETSYEEPHSEGELSVAKNILDKIDFTEQGVSKKALNDLFQRKYQIDFSTEYADLLSDTAFSSVILEGNSLGDPQAAAYHPRYRPIVYSFDPEHNAALGQLSDLAWVHLKRIYDIIDPETANWKSKSEFINAVVNNAIKGQKSNIKSNCCLSKQEKDILIVALDAYRDNISDIYDLVEREGSWVPTPQLRIRWKRFWRRVRSVVVSTAVGAAAGFATCLCPAGAIIGAATGFIGSTLDLIVNDRCHYATQCPRGWEQNCTTTQCWDNPNWPPTGGNTGGGGSNVGDFIAPTTFTNTPNLEGCNDPCCDLYRARKGNPSAKVPFCAAENHIDYVNSLDVYPFAINGVTDRDFPFSLAGAVDMAETPIRGKRKNVKYTALGFPRDFKYFWSVYTDPHGALSPANKQKIKDREAPKVDVQWQQRMPGQKYAPIGDVIHHHHVLQGRWAIPVAKSLHISGQYYSMLHPKYKDSHAFVSSENALMRAGKTLYGRFSSNTLRDLIMDTYTEDPLALYNQIYGYKGDPISVPVSGYFTEGRLYYIVGEDAYLKVIKLYEAKGKLVEFNYKVYDGYGYDEYVEGYFGIGVIAEGTAKVGLGMGRSGNKNEKTRILP